MIFLFLMVISLKILAWPIVAAEEPVFISEVLPQPSSGKEWVEIYNPSNQEIDLTGYSLADQASQPNPIYTFTQTLASKSFLVIHLSSNYLNNTGDTVFLLDSDQQIIDQLSYTSSQDNLSWSKNSAGDEPIQTEPNPNQFSDLPEPSPSPSPITTPSPTPAGILGVSAGNSVLKLTEVMSCPESNQPEWIEFFNGSSQSLELTNWQLKDTNQNLIPVNLNVSATSYAIFSWSQSILNNSGDILYIYDHNQNLHAQLNLPSCQKNQSYALIDESWQVGIPTPNSANLGVVAQASPTPSTNTKSTPSPSVEEQNQMATTKINTAQISTPSNKKYQYGWPKINLVDRTLATSSASATPSAGVKLLSDRPNIQSTTQPSLRRFLPLAGLSLILIIFSSFKLWQLYSTRFKTNLSFEDLSL